LNGCWIGNSRGNSGFIGSPVRQTWRIILQNIIRQPTIAMCEGIF
jgi:hypothetical protein